MKLYTIREAAEALGTNKTAIRRLMKQIPPEELSAGSYRGQPTILISQKGFETLVSLQAERFRGKHNRFKRTHIRAEIQDRGPGSGDPGEE